jgi:stringent starvation protein B
MTTLTCSIRSIHAPAGSSGCSEAARHAFAVALVREGWSNRAAPAMCEERRQGAASGTLMERPSALPPKKDVALALLQGPSVFIHLDPRRPGVVVPKWLQSQPQLVLQVGLSMPVPIVDLEVGDEAVSCTLSFSRSPFWCYLPWPAVYALVGEDGRGMIWPEDVPPELSRPAPRVGLRAVDVPGSGEHDEPIVNGGASGAGQKRNGAGGTPGRTRLRAVPEGAGEPAPVDEPPASSARTNGEGARERKLPPYLRVVK